MKSKKQKKKIPKLILNIKKTKNKIKENDILKDLLNLSIKSENDLKKESSSNDKENDLIVNKNNNTLIEEIKEDEFNNYKYLISKEIKEDLKNFDDLEDEESLFKLNIKENKDDKDKEIKKGKKKQL